MATLSIRSVSSIEAEISVPGDKSVSHRALLFSALSDGECEISGFLAGEDCLSTAEALRQMGVEIAFDETDPTRLKVRGIAGRFTKPEDTLDCGNSGTTMRLLSGILAAQPFTTRLTGDDSLRKRPMDRVAIPLRQMGARVEGIGDRCTAPLRIDGSGELAAIDYESPVASAQIKSAILLAGLFAKGVTSVNEPHLSRDHTERMFDYLGVITTREGTKVSLQGGQVPTARDIVVPADISSAAFWLVAAAAREGSWVKIDRLGLNPTRVGILSVLSRMGAKITQVIDDSGCEPMGSVEIHGTQLKGTEIGGEEIPTLIDEIPIIAVAAALAEGKTVIRDAAELRVKESDRIAAVADNLRRMGVQVEEFADGMEIEGGAQLRGAEIQAIGDHRIGMSFAIAGLFAKGPTVIHGAECIDTSYPDFVTEIKALQKLA